MVIGGRENNTTNNIMELMGPLEGLGKARRDFGKIKCEVISDSKYFVNGFNSWINLWFDREGNHIKKPLLKNKDMWLQLHAIKNKSKATWVRGHAGHIENNLCDILANAYCFRVIEGSYCYDSLESLVKFTEQAKFKLMK